MTPATSQPVIELTQAAYAGDHRLRLTFADHTERLIDFAPFLFKSQHPEIRKYLDQRRFQKFAIDRGHLHWNDFDLIFPLPDLYAGKIS